MFHVFLSRTIRATSDSGNVADTESGSAFGPGNGLCYQHLRTYDGQDHLHLWLSHA